MIDLKNLINMLPYMYKSRDTYKVNDQGILERFINILGYYLNDEVLPEEEPDDYEERLIRIMKMRLIK